MGGLELGVFLLSSFGIGLKGSIFDILNILFSYFILFFRHRVLKFDLYLSRQACKVNLSFIRVTGGGGGGEDAGGGGYLLGEVERGGRGGVDAAADRDGGGVLTEDEGGIHEDGVGLSGEDVRGGVEAGGGVLTEDAMRPSVNEKIFLVYKEKEQE